MYKSRQLTIKSSDLLTFRIRVLILRYETALHTCKSQRQRRRVRSVSLSLKTEAGLCKDRVKCSSKPRELSGLWVSPGGGWKGCQVSGAGEERGAVY